MFKSDSQHNSYNLSVSGMHCASCVSRLEKSLNQVNGIQEANANFATGNVKISVLDSVLGSEILETIEKVGYQISLDEIRLKFSSKGQNQSTDQIVRTVEQEPGVTSVEVNVANNTAKIAFIKGIGQLENIMDRITKIGLEVEPIEVKANESLESGNNAERVLLRQKFLISLSLTLPLFSIEMSSHFIPQVHVVIEQTIGHQTSRIFQFVLTTILLLGPGKIFLRSGLQALWRLAPDMNSLVAIGTTAAWGYSTIATFFPYILPSGTAHVYYESAAIIVTLILFGRYLESRAKGVANNAIQQLVELAPSVATVIEDGVEKEVPISQIQAGTIVKIKPGEKISVDGIVESGETYVDESLISGEPIPKRKTLGDKVIGGTINQSGSINVRATNVGANSVISRIIQLVEDAQTAKLPIQALVDRITAWFVPIIIGISLLTFVIWLAFATDNALNYAVVTAVAVLIIACPCAMGLATPTSIIVGTGKAATFGILFRNGISMERLKRISVLAFDKTGTLTEGKPNLRNIIPVANYSEEELLKFAATLESNSEHPIAKAICSAAKAQNLKIDEVIQFESVTGQGVTGVVNGKKILLGTSAFLQKNGINTEKFNETSKKLTREAHSIFSLAIDGQFAGIFAVADPIKKTALTTVQAIQKFGIKVVMLSGDNTATANAVGKSLGIDEVFAELLPEDKINKIKDLQQYDQVVGFVGDGINDAPAISGADVGIAIGTGTDVAIESAEVVLMSDNLQGVVNAIALSRATMRNISENLFWAFGYNVCLIPVAAGILYPSFGLLLSPVFAAAAMSISSVFVVFNSLRLKLFKP